MFLPRASRALPLFALVALFVTGCGGGGGHNNGSGSAVGKVVVLNEGGGQVTASPVPAAQISLEGGGPSTATLSQGSYELDGVSSGLHRVQATAKVNGVTYTGSTEVLIQDNTQSSNATIIVSPSDRQATLTGHVFDQYTQRPIYDARVFVQVPVSSAGDAASLVAFTDENGGYRLPNVPANDSVNTGYTAAASVLHYQNTSVSVVGLRAGETRTADFGIVPSANQGTGTPAIVAVQSFTQPGASPTPSAVRAHLAGTAASSVYEQIRRTLSPAYARLSASAHPAASTRRTAQQSPFGSYAIETDVFFQPVSVPSLAGYRIYQSAGTSAPAAYDFLQDPLASVYTDLSPGYVPNQQYNFAVSAVNTDQSESAASATASVVPLDPLTLTQPQAGQSVGSPATVAWTAVRVGQGETLNYAVFVYDQFPSIAVSPVVQSAALDAGTTSYTVSGTLAGGRDYWVVVAASANDGAEISVSPITRFHVP